MNRYLLKRKSAGIIVMAYASTHGVPSLVAPSGRRAPRRPRQPDALPSHNPGALAVLATLHQQPGISVSEEERHRLEEAYLQQAPSAEGHLDAVDLERIWQSSQASSSANARDRTLPTVKYDSSRSPRGSRAKARHSVHAAAGQRSQRCWQAEPQPAESKQQVPARSEDRLTDAEFIKMMLDEMEANHQLKRVSRYPLALLLLLFTPVCFLR